MTTRRSFLRALIGMPAVAAAAPEATVIFERNPVPDPGYTDFLRWMTKDITAVTGIPYPAFEQIALLGRLRDCVLLDQQ